LKANTKKVHQYLEGPTKILVTEVFQGQTANKSTEICNASKVRRRVQVPRVAVAEWDIVAVNVRY